MANRGKNHARNQIRGGVNAPWFNVRQGKGKKLRKQQKASRKANRRKG